MGRARREIGRFACLVTGVAVSVLVVDDDASFRDALASGTKSEGFFVRVAIDGKSALHAFGDTAPD